MTVKNYDIENYNPAEIKQTGEIEHDINNQAHSQNNQDLQSIIQKINSALIDINNRLAGGKL